MVPGIAEGHVRLERKTASPADMPGSIALIIRIEAFNHFKPEGGPRCGMLADWFTGVLNNVRGALHLQQHGTGGTTPGQRPVSDPFPS